MIHSDSVHGDAFRAYYWWSRGVTLQQCRDRGLSSLSPWGAGTFRIRTAACLPPNYTACQYASDQRIYTWPRTSPCGSTWGRGWGGMGIGGTGLAAKEEGNLTLWTGPASTGCYL